MTTKTNTPQEYMSTAQAAEFMNVKVTTIRAWARTGFIPAYKVGPRLWRFRRADLIGLRR